MRKFGWYFYICMVLCIPSCAPRLSYKRRELIPLKPNPNTKTSSTKSVTMLIKPFDTSLLKEHFKQKKLSVRPIQIAIINESETEWILTRNNIKTSLARPENIAMELQSSYWPSYFLPISRNDIETVNNIIMHDILSKSFDICMYIPPHTQKDTLLFVDKKICSEHLEVYLIDAKNPKNKQKFIFS